MIIKVRGKEERGTTMQNKYKNETLFIQLTHCGHWLACLLTLQLGHLNSWTEFLSILYRGNGDIKEQFNLQESEVRLAQL